jgi:hypothetical protein
MDINGSFEAFLLEANSRIEDYMALPVIEDCHIGTDTTWNLLVVGEGVQWCAFSSSVLGNHGQKAVSQDKSTKLTLVQRALLETITVFHNNKEDVDQPGKRSLRVQNMIASLNQRICPKSLEVMGDDRTLVIPRQAFDANDPSFQSLIPATEETEEFWTELWQQLARFHGSPRVVRRGGIDPKSPIRQSGTTLLWPISGIPTETGTCIRHKTFRSMIWKASMSSSIFFL